MISYLTGKAIYENDGALILDVRDVGYQVFVTEGTLAWALAMTTPVSLWIHTVVRETAFDLYGFERQNELYFFKKLLDVSGIGPKSALAMLGLSSTDTLYQAIMNENVEFLTSVPGIGAKTAKRMCIELKDKLKDYQGNTELHTNEHDRDVVDALLALGYSITQAHQAISELDPKITDRNERIKNALAILAS
jgi:Holliday junction DNA helicase RuvA